MVTPDMPEKLSHAARDHVAVLIPKTADGAGGGGLATAKFTEVGLDFSQSRERAIV